MTNCLIKICEEKIELMKLANGLLWWKGRAIYVSINFSSRSKIKQYNIDNVHEVNKK